MPFVKGKSGNPKGKPPGEHKATRNAREALARLIDGNVHRVQKWLDEIAEEDGAKAAMAAFTDLIEYHVPKLQRTEHTGPDGGAIVIKSDDKDRSA